MDGTSFDDGEKLSNFKSVLNPNYGSWKLSSPLEDLVSQGISDKSSLSKDKKAKSYTKNMKEYLSKVFNQTAENGRYFSSTRRGELKNKNLAEFKKKEFYINTPNALAGNNQVMDQFRPDEIHYKPDIDNGQKNDDPISLKKKLKKSDGSVSANYRTISYSGMGKNETERALCNRVYQNDDDAFAPTRKVSEKTVNLKSGSLMANTKGKHYKVKKRENNEKIDKKLVDCGALGDEPWQSLYN